MVWVKDGAGVVFKSGKGAMELLSVTQLGTYYAWVERLDGVIEYSRKAEVYMDKGSSKTPYLIIYLILILFTLGLLAVKPVPTKLGIKDCNKALLNRVGVKQFPV